MDADEFKPEEIETGVKKVNYICVFVLYVNISFCEGGHGLLEVFPKFFNQG